MKPKFTYRVSDSVNGVDLEVKATSVANAAAIAAKQISSMLAFSKREYVRPRTDATTGGWHGLHIDLPTCVHKSAGKPTPRPGPRHMATKH